MNAIERLDREKAPSGYVVWLDDGWQMICWGLESDGKALNRAPGREPDLTTEKAIAAAWTHYQENNDPPGMKVHCIASGPWSDDGEEYWVVQVFDHAVEHAGPTPRPSDATKSEQAARAAAWAWYWARVAVATTLESIWSGTCEIVDGTPEAESAQLFALSTALADKLAGRERVFWPQCLAWSDEQVADVESWLTGGIRAATKKSWAGKVPEVLRG